MADSGYGGWRRLLPTDFNLLHRLLGTGGRSHAELLSYLFFDGALISDLIRLGRADASALLELEPAAEPWRLTGLGVGVAAGSTAN